MKQEISEEQRKSGILTGAAIAFLLLALPLAVWLDLTELSKTALRRQAADLNSVITSVRSYYASNVVGRILANPNGSTRVVHNYESDPRRDSDPGDAVAGARPGDRGAAGKHHLPFRLGLPVPEPRPAPARQVREGRAGSSARGSRAEDRRDRDLAVQRQGPADRSGDDGPGLRQLPQQPPREPEEGLEGRRRQRHPGGDHRPADRRQHLLVQVFAGLLPDRCRQRLVVPLAAAPSGEPHQGHEQGARNPPTISSPRSR